MSPFDDFSQESHPHYPNGSWTGFYLQRAFPGRHRMTLHLTFRAGHLTGEGSDVVGPFTLSGAYDLQDGKCRWTKHYLGKHDVSYRGVNEGKGIWGVWEIRALGGLYQDRGVFHVWPEGLIADDEADLTEKAGLADDRPGALGPALVRVLLWAGAAALAFLSHYWWWPQ